MGCGTRDGMIRRKALVQKLWPCCYGLRSLETSRTTSEEVRQGCIMKEPCPDLFYCSRIPETVTDLKTKLFVSCEVRVLLLSGNLVEHHLEKRTRGWAGESWGCQTDSLQPTPLHKTIFSIICECWNSFNLVTSSQSQLHISAVEIKLPWTSWRGH